MEIKEGWASGLNLGVRYHLGRVDPFHLYARVTIATMSAMEMVTMMMVTRMDAMRTILMNELE